MGVIVVVVSRSGERKRNKRKIVYRERVGWGLTKFVLEMREKQRKEGRRGPI